MPDDNWAGIDESGTYTGGYPFGIPDEPKKPRRKHGSVLTLDEQLTAFCNKWEQDRAAKVAKYRKSAEHWKAQPGSGLVYTGDLRRAEHYEHELAMVTELRRRALSARPPQSEGTTREDSNAAE